MFQAPGGGGDYSGETSTLTGEALEIPARRRCTPPVFQALAGRLGRHVPVWLLFSEYEDLYSITVYSPELGPLWDPSQGEG